MCGISGWVGRAASDAKGPVAMFLRALDLFDGHGFEQLFDLKVIMDFEEELGSPHLPPALDDNREALAADWLLIFDGPRHPSNLFCSTSQCRDGRSLPSPSQS